METRTTYYLEMKAPAELRSREESNGLQVRECQIKQFQFNKYLYQLVGSDWDWTTKIPWSDDEWVAYSENDNLRTWVGYKKGSPIGYYELRKIEADTEIASFGMAPNFIGRGYGGCLLTKAIECAWEWEGTQRVLVHTCTTDHPYALANYQARGMKLYHTKTTTL